MMSNSIKSLSLGLLLVFTTSVSVLADTVLEKVAKTGVLTAGTRTDFIPLAYQDDKGNLVGYSIDILNQIRSQLEKEIGKLIKLELVSVDIAERISKLRSGDVDIICEGVSFTWNRDRAVDFSMGYGITGPRLLVKRDSSLSSPESLAQKRIAVLSDGTAAQTLRVLQPQATYLPVKTMNDGLAALDQGQADAFAADGVLLEGTRQTLKTPDAYKVVPSSPFTKEGIACMIPENNSGFLNSVNYAIASLMQGYLIGQPQATEKINRWLGPNGIVTIDPVVLRKYFQDVIDSYEQVNLSQ
jgi:polar amino acid transport system substrate-binding protein